MAANGERASRREKASPREFITALAAVLVTGVVGLATVIVSCQSSRDSERTTREAQREAARAQLTQTDLRELRSVLDRAEADLQRLDSAVSAMYEATLGGERVLPGQLRARYAAASRAAEGSEARLAIRLPMQSACPRYFRLSQDAYDVAGRILGAEPLLYTSPRPPTWRDSRQALKEHAEGRDMQTRFIEAARKLVGSQLPER